MAMMKAGDEGTTEDLPSAPWLDFHRSGPQPTYRIVRSVRLSKLEDNESYDTKFGQRLGPGENPMDKNVVTHNIVHFHELPAFEEGNGLFDCAKSPAGVNLESFCCPCIQMGRQVEATDGGFGGFSCLGATLFCALASTVVCIPCANRRDQVTAFGRPSRMNNVDKDRCLATWLCIPCALSQQNRELFIRGAPPGAICTGSIPHVKRPSATPYWSTSVCDVCTGGPAALADQLFCFPCHTCGLGNALDHDICHYTNPLASGFCFLLTLPFAALSLPFPVFGSYAWCLRKAAVKKFNLMNRLTQLSLRVAAAQSAPSPRHTESTRSATPIRVAGRWKGLAAPKCPTQRCEGYLR